MADLDDLLGDGPTATPQAKPAGGGDVDDLDDLLGGGGGGAADDANMLDDDLLFGGPSSPSSAPAAAAPPKPAAQPQRSEAVNLPKIQSQVTETLKPLTSENTFFVQIVQQIASDGARNKRVLSIDNALIHLYDVGGNKTREIDIQRLFGIILQKKAKRMGGKDVELQYLFQIDGEPDVMFALVNEAANGDPSAFASAENVLTTIIAGWGLNLPVALVPDAGGQESLMSLARFRPTPDVRVRHGLTESLAYRSELQHELDALRKKNSTLDINIMQLKSSAEGQTTGSLTAEINQLEDAIRTFTEKRDALLTKKTSALAEREKVFQEMSEEEKRRDEAIKDKVRGDEQEMLLRRAKEFELMKAAHRRDMEKLSFLTGLYEEHCNNRAADSYSGVQLTIRLEELEEEQESLQGHLKGQQESYSALMAAVQEVKKRISLARDVQERLDADIKVLKDTPLDAELPAGLAHTDLPDITPVSREADGVKKTAVRTPPPPSGSPAASSPAASPAPTPAKKVPIDLSDDDDI